MSLKKLDVSITSKAGTRVLPSFQAGETHSAAIATASRYPLGLETLVHETQKIGMYPVMLPAPTRMDWHNFMLGLSRITVAASRDEAREYYTVYPERAIDTSRATRALKDKETTHYIQQYMAAQQLVISRAVNVLNIARLSGVLYAEEAAATLRFSTFNTLLRSLQGTPMTSWVYDSIFSIAKNFIHESSESGLTVLFPYFMNPEDEWFDLPTIFGSATRPVGGVTRRPPTLTECMDSGEFCESGTWNGTDTHADLTSLQVTYPENFYSGLSSGSLAALKYYDQLFDWLIAELAAAVENMKTKFGRNANNKLNLVGPTQNKDTVIWWNELGVVGGQFDIANLFDDINKIELFDYEALADAPERNFDPLPSPSFARAPGSLVAADEDHSGLSRWLLRSFVFSASAETYAGQYRIAFDLDDDQYWDNNYALDTAVLGGTSLVAKIPQEFPYAGITADDVAAIGELLEDSALNILDASLLGATEPGTPALTGLTTQMIKEKLLRYGSQQTVYVSPEDRGAIANNINSDKNTYISNTMLAAGLFMPMWKKYPIFNPLDPFQHGEFLILDIENDIAKPGSWAAALSTVGAFNSDATIEKPSATSITRRGLADANITVATDAVPWQTAQWRIAVGLAWVFIGDALRISPSLHFRRQDIAFLASVATDQGFPTTHGAVCPIPVRLHSNYPTLKDLSYHATDMSVEGITYVAATGVFTFDKGDGNIGLQDAAILDINRVTLGEQYIIPGYFPSSIAPIKEETLFGIRALEGNADRANPQLGAILAPFDFTWNGKAPLSNLAIQRGMLIMRRTKDLKAGGKDDRSSGKSSSSDSKPNFSKSSSSKPKKKWLPEKEYRAKKAAERASKESFSADSAYTDPKADESVKKASTPGADDDYRTEK